MRPDVIILETLAPNEDWAASERRWIALYRANGARLLNRTDGGEGLAGHKFAGTEHARKIAEAMRKGRTFACEQCSTEFWRKPHEIKSGDCRFCSKQCYFVWQVGKSKPVSRAFTDRGVAAAIAKKKAQTNCKRGHLLNGDNVFRTAKGGRGCKECRKIHKITYRNKQQCLPGVKKTSLTASV